MNLTLLLNNARKELEIAKINATQDGKTAQAAKNTAKAAKTKFKHARKLVKFTRKIARKAEDQAEAALDALEKAQAHLEKLERRARKKERKHKGSAPAGAKKRRQTPVQTHPAKPGPAIASGNG
jgi:hypothetical protein